MFMLRQTDEFKDAGELPNSRTSVAFYDIELTHVDLVRTRDPKKRELGILCHRSACVIS